MKLPIAFAAWVIALAACGSAPTASPALDSAPIAADHVVVLVHGLSCPN